MPWYDPSSWDTPEWMEDLDPTAPGAKYGDISAFALGGPVGSVWRNGRKADAAARNAQRDARSAQDRAAEEAKKWADEYGEWREDWAHVGDLTDAEGNRTRTGRRFDELSPLYTGEVDRGMYDASSQVAAGYARRGLDDSGYATGAQGDVLMQAAAARATARERAMTEAIGESMKIGQGDLLALGGQAGVAMEPYTAAREFAQSQQMMNQLYAQQQQDEMMQGLMGLLSLAAL